MKAVSLVLCALMVFCAMPVFADSYTGQVTGYMGDWGSVEGSFTVDLSAPIDVNVRGLAGNTIYSVTSWDFIAQSTFSLLPSLAVLTNDPGNTFEYCTGHCVFAFNQDVTTLRISTSSLLLQLMFTPDLYGNGSWYRTTSGQFGMALFTSGDLKEYPSNVPESGNLLYGVLGILGILLWRRRDSRNTIPRY